MDKIIEVNLVLQNLREQLRGDDDVKLAIVFDSIAGRGVSSHDVDIAVKLGNREGRLLALSGLVYAIAKALDVSEERVDVVDVDQAPVHLLWRKVNGSAHHSVSTGTCSLFQGSGGNTGLLHRL